MYFLSFIFIINNLLIFKEKKDYFMHTLNY